MELVGIPEKLEVSPEVLQKQVRLVSVPPRAMGLAGISWQASWIGQKSSREVRISQNSLVRVVHNLLVSK